MRIIQRRAHGGVSSKVSSSAITALNRMCGMERNHASRYGSKKCGVETNITLYIAVVFYEAGWCGGLFPAVWYENHRFGRCQSGSCASR